MAKMLRSLFFVAAVLVGLATGEAGQQAFSIPSSDKLIRLELGLPGNKAARIDVREGSMATIRDTSRGYHYAIIASLDKSSGRPKVTLLEIVERGDGSQEIQALGDVRDLALGETGGIETPKGRVEVNVVEVSNGSFSVPPLSQPLDKSTLSDLTKVYGKAGGVCCVTCDDVTVCAATVKLSCGSCSSGGAGYGGLPI